MATIDTPIGAVEPQILPLWLPAPARGRPRPFVGRVPELWQLHSALHPDVAPLTSPHLPAIAVVHGVAGIGKTVLVTEYAYRFAAAFPGGIFWLTGRADVPAQLAAMAGVLSTRDVDPARATDVLAAYLHQRGLPSLWVLDGFPPGDPRPALAPHPLARSVLTTSDPGFREFGTAIALHPLDKADIAALPLPVPATNLLRDITSGHPTEADNPSAPLLVRTGLAQVDGSRLVPSPLIGTTRPPTRRAAQRHRTLAGARPANRGSAGLAATVVLLLEDNIRPLLAHWHPELMAYEETRTQPNPVAHELDWPRRPELHTALGELAETLRATIADLSVITGSGYGLTR